jgi:RNA polymerase sigma factor (sigma-70 family)
MWLSKNYLAGARASIPFTPEQELEIFRDYNARGRPEVIKNRIIKSNLRLVIKIAAGFKSSPGMDFEDLVGEGNLGLIYSIDRFDPERGSKFSTYCGYWIRRYVRKAVFDQGRTIRVPTHIQNTLYCYRTYYLYLSQELQRRPTQEEMADSLNISIKKVRGLSMDGATCEDGFFDFTNRHVLTELAEGVSDVQAEFMAREQILELHRAIARLTPGERQVIQLRFLTEDKVMCYRSIGRRMGFTYQRAQQLGNKALEKLKRRMV